MRLCEGALTAGCDAAGRLWYMWCPRETLEASGWTEGTE